MPKYPTVWLDYLKKKGVSLDVEDVLVHLIMHQRKRDNSPLPLDTIFWVCLICHKHAGTMT